MKMYNCCKKKKSELPNYLEERGGRTVEDFSFEGPTVSSHSAWCSLFDYPLLSNSKYTPLVLTFRNETDGVL